MPTYNYRCMNCEYTFEIKLPMKDNLKPEEIPCPMCTGPIKQQILTATPWVADKPQPPADWKEWTNKLKKSNPGSDFTTW